MTKRMLIDATHAEETRVVVMDGPRLHEYDVEAANRRQLKGNIYLAKVVRVEPSLQAAFVEYGGNRHGFLAFGEIHPDYYQIPVADRQRLIELQEQEARAEEEAADAAERDPDAAEASAGEATVPHTDGEPAAVTQAAPVAPEMRVAPEEAATEFPDGEVGVDIAPEAAEAPERLADSQPAYPADAEAGAEPLETIGGEHDTSDEAAARERRSSRLLRHYKIQEVIRRRQILLVQVVKEERGNKGAALTTYISMAGRYSVLMPNSPRGGGVSRKITSAADRRRLKEVTTELRLPRGMGIIVRTAGANRPKPEITRDCESLLRQWDGIRETTMESVAPALIYEEASLIKRALRDSYSGDVEEVIVDGEAGWRQAHDYMRMMMPTHARKVQLWREGGQPLFARHSVEAQLDQMMQPTVQLRSGGYLVINQTEALVAIDVNSGRSTRERGIEETALRTNMEAAEEVARQLRLRDLAGLIVIDFIDMESRRHNTMVERRIRDALATDRARIQLGQISHFGLMEMSRQRLRPSIAETSQVPCAHCGGTGHVRSIENAALHVLRAIEEEGAKRRAAEIVLHCAASVAMYVLNHKRDRLTEIESRTAMRVTFAADEGLLPPNVRVERLRPQTAPPPQATAPDRPTVPDQTRAPSRPMREARIAAETGDEAGEAANAAEDAGAETTDAERADAGARRRRRRRRGGRREGGDPTEKVEADAADGAGDVTGGDAEEATTPANDAEAPANDDAEQSDAPDESASSIDGRGRRRGRRGGRRRRRDEDGPDSPVDESEAQSTLDQDVSPAPLPRPASRPAARTIPIGPTPADPFGGGALDIFEALEQALEARSVPPADAPVPQGASGATVEPLPPPVAAALDLPEPIESAAPVGVDPVAADPLDAAQTTEPLPENTATIRPTVISEDASAPKRRGWWRRGG